MSSVTCTACEARFKREIPASLHGIYRELAERTPPVCDTCCTQAERAAEEEARVRADQERAERRRRRLEASGIPEQLRGLTWERCASDVRPEAIEAAQRWARGELRGLFLTGPVGVGKTWIAAIAASARLARGPLRWVAAPVLLAHLALSFENPLHERALVTLSDELTGALVLDDIDKARPSEYAAQQLFCAIDNRVTAGAQLLVTSNLILPKLRDRYPHHGQAIVSRLAGYCDPLLVEGRDRRLDRYRDAS